MRGSLLNGAARLSRYLLLLNEQTRPRFNSHDKRRQLTKTGGLQCKQEERGLLAETIHKVKERERRDVQFSCHLRLKEKIKCTLASYFDLLS